MKKGFVALAALMLLSMTGASYAVETEYGELGIDVDVTWVSKYIFRGIDVLDDKAATQPSINFDLFGSGFSFNVWSSHAGASKRAGSVSTVNAEEWDYTIAYANSLCEGQSYKTDYALSYVYYDYPDMASRDADTQEWNLALSWPELCPAGIVPSYVLVNSWPSRSGGLVRNGAGWIHVFGLNYGLGVEGFLPDNPEQVFNFMWNITYNDGTYGVAHDWSHVLWGVSTSINLPYGVLTPALYYQTSMERTVNTEDEFWVGVSYGFGF
ncbi:MAG: TorF family putative porin [Planctomycetota bacterium]|jgi:hypothetical protein